LPGWAFTVGLFENFGHPEVTIFVMEPKTRDSILNWIGKNESEGKPFTADREHDWVLEQHNCWSRAVQKVWYRDLFGWAIWFYGGTDFPVVQCLWPADCEGDCSSLDRSMIQVLMVASLAAFTASSRKTTVFAC
jgi:Domain of unknown function (DUF4262)